MNERELYSIGEAREHLGGVSRGFIYELLHRGELTSVVIGCRRFISRGAILDLIAKSTTEKSPATDNARDRKPDQNRVPGPLPNAIRTVRRRQA